jgi:hypothetical protein
MVYVCSYVIYSNYCLNFNTFFFFWKCELKVVGELNFT